jgi:hypothetical protein
MFLSDLFSVLNVNSFNILFINIGSENETAHIAFSGRQRISRSDNVIGQGGWKPGNNYGACTGITGFGRG